MIVPIVQVIDPDRFLEVFRMIGATKRREHGCRSARAYVDPDDTHRMWSVLDWDPERYAEFLADPEIPAIAEELKLKAPPVHVVATIELDT